MSLPTINQIVEGPNSLGFSGTGPYEPSIASSASSSQASIFSDAASAQSSVASSISDDFRSSQEDVRDRYCAPAQEQLKYSKVAAHLSQACHKQLSYADVTSVPSQQRQHPRRCSSAKNHRPPPLVRQADRKVNFVDNLVDSATQMVEVIWPLSMVPSNAIEGSSGRSVLPLRTYIEETLRRSRTSYSTLQVALYYLILIKPWVPKRDFTMEQTGDCPADRALMCGRRMFLAALILASKYLQDRNYSAKAWSKMSGLPVKEINANERTFLAKIGWKLHVAKPLFDRWTDVVIKYQTMPPPSPGQSSAVEELCWKKLVPMLTPELDNVPLPERMAKSVMESVACAELPLPALAPPSLARSPVNAMNVNSSSQETTPTPASIFPPRFLEPRPNIAPPTPALARMGPLPTPQLTPAISSIASSTPAVSACGPRRPSMCSAMAFAQRAGFNRCIGDEFPGAGLERYQTRRPSVSSTLSSRSSPESMISDHSRSSRASSISSVTTASSAASCVAPPRANLARLATTRNARMPLSSADVMEEDDKESKSNSAQPIVISDDETAEHSPPNFAISQRKLHAPHRHSKQHQQQQQQHQPTSAPAAEKSRKRHRPTRGNRRNDLYDEVRFQLQEEEAEDDDVQMLDLVSNDSDEDMVSPSPAAAQASAMLRRDMYQCKEAQPLRLPVQKNEGKKRTCCDTSAAARFGFGPQAVFGRA